MVEVRLDRGASVRQDLSADYNAVIVVLEGEGFIGDRSLRDCNPTWGLRDLEAVAAIAQSVGFSGPTMTEMPANNLSVVFHRI